MVNKEIKRFSITAAQNYGLPNKAMLVSLDKYNKENDSETIILPMNGKSVTEDELHPDLHQYNITDSNFNINKNVKVSNYKIRAQQILPLTGIRRFAAGDKSFIFASPKINLEYVPNGYDVFPKAIMTTGACTEPNYNTKNRIGRIAKQDHEYGFVAVEKVSNSIFHFRQVPVLKNGKFVDLGILYDGKKKPRKAITKALVVGDLHPYETNKAHEKCTFQQIKHFKPETLFLHDSFNGTSISHHYAGDNLKKHSVYKDQGLSLQDELSYTCEVLNKYAVAQAKHGGKVYIVASNHDEFLVRYLTAGRFIGDKGNDLVGSKLYTKALEGLNPLEAGLNMFGGLEKNIVFLERAEDFKILGYQLANHADLGSNGARGSPKSMEEANGKSISGHCFSDDTEILTKKGWIKGINLTTDDVVMTMNKDSRKAEWNDVEEINVFDNYNELFHLKSKACDLLVTDKHGLIAEHTNGKLQEFTAEEFSTIPSQFKFLNALSTENTLEYDHDMLRLIVQIVTDGSYDGNAIRFHLKKQRKIDSLTSLLDDLNVPYSNKVQRSGSTKIRIPVKVAKALIALIPNKTLPDWFINLSEECIDVVLSEYSVTDGCVYSNKRYQLSTSKKQDADLLQSLCILKGYRCLMYNKPNGNYALNVTKVNNIIMTNKHMVKVSYSGKVWCPTVKNGTLVVRRNGKPMVTQNTHTARKMRQTYSVGTSTNMRLGYNRGNSNWVNANAVLYETGTVQLLNTVKKSWGK